MKLSEWAKQQGISYKTAWRWVKDGKMPVPFEQIATGTILVREPERPSGAVVVYARVSSQDQTGDLDRQVARLVQYANSQGWMVAGTVTEVGSGLNGRRPKFRKLLSDPDVKIIVAEHRDPLLRFGFEYLEASLAAQGRKIVVVDPGEMRDDLVQDMVEVLTSFCARLYGQRSARNRAKRAMDAITGERQ